MSKSPIEEIITQEVYDLFDQYVHNAIERRDFIEKLSMLSLGGFTALEVFKYLSPDYNTAEISKDDSELVTERIHYTSSKGGGKIEAQLSRMKDAASPLPGVVVVHENRGLNPYIEDVGRRLAKAGFISLAPDALSPLGGYPGNDDEGRAMQRERNRDEMLQDFIAAFYFLRSHKECSGNVGVIGFCFGGYISNMMAAMVPELKASIPFYGGQAPLELVENISAPLQLHYAENDERVNAGWPEYRDKLESHEKSVEFYFYEGTKHGFHNNTTPRYDKAAAELAWDRSISFFNKHLK